MAEQLKTGQFFGESLSRSLWPGAVLTELSHVEQRRLPLHTHESAFFLLLVRGGYAEWFGNRALEYRPLSVGIHPPGFRHRDAIRPGGASSSALR